MPQSPAANPAQKEILSDMVSLSQNSAVAIGNQIAVVDSQLTRFANAQQIFQERYAYWDNYIGAYHAERKSLNGVFILNPIVQQNYTDFLLTKGRIYKAKILSPIRIAQFNQVTASPSGTEANNEINFLAKEAQYRSFLQSGFAATNPLPVFPGFYALVNPFSPGDTTMTIRGSPFAPFSVPRPGQVLVYDTTSPTGGVIVEYLTSTQPSIGFPEYLLQGLKYSPVFTTIPLNSPVESSGITFTNAERTTKITTSPQQSRLNAYIEGYRYRIQSWSANLSAQVTQLAAEITAGENTPDTAYAASVQATTTALLSYLTTMDVSNTGLTAQQALYALRAGQNPARIAWIDARLIQTAKAYDQRYHYADRLYNLSDGTFPLIAKFQGQKKNLASQQAASNYRAAQLSGEIF